MFLPKKKDVHDMNKSYIHTDKSMSSVCSLNIVLKNTFNNSYIDLLNYKIYEFLLKQKHFIKVSSFFFLRA